MDGKLIAALIYAPFKAVGNVLKVVLSNKILLVALIVLIGFIVVKTQFLNNDDAASVSNIPEYQKSLPSVAIAPRIVQTTSRYYPYSTFSDTTNFLILTDYYTYFDGKWQHSITPLPIEKSRVVKIYAR